MVEMCGSTDHECITGYDLYLNALNDLKLLMINGAHTFSKMFIENIIKDGAGNIFQDTDAMQEMSLPVKKMPSEEGYTSHNSTVNTSVDDVTTNNNNQKEISDDSAAGADSQTAQLRYIKCRTTCDDILHNVVTRLTADCKTTLHLSFVKLLTNALESTVQELIIAPSYEVPITSGYIHTYIYTYTCISTVWWILMSCLTVHILCFPFVCIIMTSIILRSLSLLLNRRCCRRRS